MGNSSSQTVKQYVSNSSSFSETVSSTLNLKNNSSINGTNINQFTLVNGGADCCVIRNKDGSPAKNKAGDTQYLPGCSSNAEMDCGKNGLNITQNALSNTKVVQSVDSENIEDLSTKLQNDAQTDIANALNQLQQNDLFSGIFNETKQKVETSINNAVKSAFSTTNVTNIVNSAVVNSWNQNNAQLINCGTITGNQCTFNQNASAQILVQNILNSLGELSQSNSQINDFYNKVNNALTQKQQGVFASFFDAIAKLGTLGIVLLAVGALIVLLLFVAFFILIFFKGGGKEASKTALQTAAANPQMYM